MKRLNRYSNLQQVRFTKSFYDWLLSLGYPPLYFKRISSGSLILTSNVTEDDFKSEGAVSMMIDKSLFHIPGDVVHNIDSGKILHRITAADYRFVESTTEEVVLVDYYYAST